MCKNHEIIQLDYPLSLHCIQQKKNLNNYDELSFMNIHCIKLIIYDQWSEHRAYQETKGHIDEKTE